MQAFEPAFELSRRFPAAMAGLFGILAKSVIYNSSSTEAFLGAAACLSSADSFPLDLSAILSFQVSPWSVYSVSVFPAPLKHPTRFTPKRRVGRPRPHAPRMEGASCSSVAAVGAATLKHTRTVLVEVVSR
jgi:hypothetical protein